MITSKVRTVGINTVIYINIQPSRICWKRVRIVVFKLSNNPDLINIEDIFMISSWIIYIILKDSIDIKKQLDEKECRIKTFPSLPFICRVTDAVKVIRKTQAMTVENVKNKQYFDGPLLW